MKLLIFFTIPYDAKSIRLSNLICTDCQGFFPTKWLFPCDLCLNVLCRLTLVDHHSTSHLYLIEITDYSYRVPTPNRWDHRCWQSISAGGCRIQNNGTKSLRYPDEYLLLMLITNNKQNKQALNTALAARTVADSSWEYWSNGPYMHSFST